ncbi:MAG: DUF1929 domain-containing protein [Meiothermus sp.]|nr:DUF1929 domain-containing protein [Meiothermus sp.]
MKIRFLKAGGLGVALALLITGCPQSTPQPPATLEPPRNVIASALSPNQVRLVWQPAANATPSTNYAVERKVVGDSGFQSVNTNLSATSFEDNSVPVGARTYTYRVRAVSASGQSAWVESNPVPLPAPCASNPAEAPSKGCFGPVRSNWPVVPTFSALLPNGKVIGWYASDENGKYRERTDVHNTDPRSNATPGAEDGTLAAVWNPASDTFQDASFGNRNSLGATGRPKGTDLFCAGFTVMTNGKFFTAGGGIGLQWGSIHTNIYDPISNTWTTGPDTSVPDMWRDRWYPTVTKLPDGRLLITGGTAKPDPSFVEGSTSTPNNPCRTPSGKCPTGLAEGVPGGLSVGIRSNVANTAYNNSFEVYDPSTGTLSMLNANASAIASFEHYYPWWHIAPNGLAFLSGAGKQKAYLNVTEDSWSPIWESTSYGIPADAHRVYGTSVMYEPNKVLVIGGGYAWFDYPNNRIGGRNNQVNGKTTIHITLSNSSTTPPNMTQGPNMQYSRTHLNATLLADGRVFVNGGQQDGGESGTLDINQWHNTVNPGTVWNPDLAVNASEIWTPGVNGGSFSPGPRAQKPRIYHSVAMLLPDATVLTAGGGGCGQCAGNIETGMDEESKKLYGSAYGQPEKINQNNHEIYSPAYLFKSDGSLAPRPVITGFSNTASSPDDYPTISYNSQFTVTWNHPDPSRFIGKVTLLALGVPTHAFNQNQRFLSLDIAQRNGLSLTVKAPYDGQYNSPIPGGARNIAPPGFYMLFLIDDRGVPSVARIVRIQ